MFDPVVLFLAISHLLLLAGGVVYACHRWRLPWRDWPFLVYVMLWAALVLAGHMASMAQRLNKLEFYVPASFVGLALVLAAFFYTHRLPHTTALAATPKIAFADMAHDQMRRIMWRVLGVSFGLMTLAAVIIAASVYPDNADSMIYRLPRAFWYVSNGSFLHPFDSIDKRATFYPVNGVALYVPLVLYNLPGTAHSIPSVLTWMAICYAVYRFGRSLGADRLLAFFATWLVGLTPGILAQSVSTNDEILAAGVLLIGFYLGWRWLLTGSRGYLLLSGIAAGLSVGTKLHIVFLAPLILAALAVAAWHIRKRPELLRRWGAAIGWKAAALTLFMTALMVVPFLVYNYLSSGRMYFVEDFAHDVFNLGANLRGALQNMLIYFSQMTISPIADLNMWPDANVRASFNVALNDLFNPLLMPLISVDPSFYHMTYRFNGVTIPTSVRFVEFSLWSGFIWMLWPFQARLALRQDFALRAIFFLFAVTPLVWLLFWSMTTLYMEGTATYFTFYLICAGPAAIFSFAAIRRAVWNEVRWMVIVIVALSNFIIGVNMFNYSGFRALPDLFYARRWPFDWTLFDQPIIDEIRRADFIRIVMTHEKMPYFAFMHWNPTAHYYTPYPIKSLPEAGKVLQLLPTPSSYEYGFMPLKIPGKNTHGATYLGTIRGIGREVIFAMGNGVETRWPDQSDYIVPHLTIMPVKNGYAVGIDEDVSGAAPEDNLEYAYELTLGDAVLYTRDWRADPSFRAFLPADPRNYDYRLTLKVRAALSHKSLTQATYPITGRAAWLPDIGEY